MAAALALCFYAKREFHLTFQFLEKVSVFFKGKVIWITPFSVYFAQFNSQF